MRQPEQTPGDDAHECQIGLEAFGRFEATLLDRAA